MKARQLFRTDQVRYGIYVIPPGNELYVVCTGAYNISRTEGLLKSFEVSPYIGNIYRRALSGNFWMVYDYDNVQKLLYDNQDAWFIVRPILLSNSLPRYRSSNILGKRRKPDYICHEIFRVRRPIKSRT